MEESMKRKLFCLGSLLALLLALLVAQPASAIAGVWTPTGSMSAGRTGYTATLLPGGKVLVAGGSTNQGTVESAELYDPATGKWTLTGSMTTRRTYHTATLLPGGKVLVTGGFTSGDDASAELYDPATGLWSSAASMTTSRFGHTATLLANGKVLVSGGAVDFRAELYDPATNTWTFTGTMSDDFTFHTALLLPDGRVLVVGSSFLGFEGDRAELYDPGTGEWTPASAFNTPRVFGEATLTLLSNGKVLLAGGFSESETALASAELYDPATDTWTETGSLLTAREGHAASLLPDGKVLVSGGWDTPSAEIYDPIKGTWSATSSPNTNRRGHLAVLLLNGKVLVVGGRSVNLEALASAELYAIPTTLAAFKSGGTQDGWVLETSATSNQGGAINAAAATFSLGDNAGNRQYRSILHFDTSSLPDNAVITKALLKIKRESVSGTDPFTTHGNVAIDIRKGAFSSAEVLQATDFQAPANKPAVGVFLNDPTAAAWYVTRLKPAAYPFINRRGMTQLRLRFQTDDDNDAVADIIKFHSGNSTAANRPVLVIEYYVP